MTKPSNRKATTRKSKAARRKPAVRTQPAPKPVEVVEEAPAPEPDQPTQDVAQAPATAPVDVAETDARSEPVSIGPVEARMKRLPTKVVLGLLSAEALRRTEAYKSSASFESTRQRLLATDGRATPVIFEDGDPPSILHGFEEIAAAVDCGAKLVSVILIPAGGASEAQQHIVEMVRLQRSKEASSDDDELFYRVHADG